MMSSQNVTGLDKIQTIEGLELAGKRVFIRCDFNVPMKTDSKTGAVTITDDLRIKAALPTIQYALDHKAKMILCSHLGRPKKPEDRKKLSLEPVAARLQELLKTDVILIEEPDSDAPLQIFQSVQTTPQILLLENLRFDPREEANDESLAKVWASYTDVYINDAFGASHRAHASIDALARLVPAKGCGFLIQKEVLMLDQVIRQPQAPFVAILGGAKVSDKIGVIEALMNKVDTFVIGGAMALTFLKAQGVAVGESRVESDKLRFAADLLERLKVRGKTVLLPIDHVVSTSIDKPQDAKTTATDAVPDGLASFDIGPQSRARFQTAILSAKTVFWNGPMGVFETAGYEKGTLAVAQALAKASAEKGTLTLVGGGDSAAAVEVLGFAKQMTHISTGGGASLEYIEAGQLPGLDALKTTK